MRRFSARGHCPCGLDLCHATGRDCFVESSRRCRMIDFYYWPTPNGWKVSIMLEECGLPYRVVPVNIGKGDQFKPEFLAISPNNRMPAIVDDDVSVFESGAILLHLAEKSGQFMPTDRQGRKETLEGLVWEGGESGPLA